MSKFSVARIAGEIVNSTAAEAGHQIASGNGRLLDLKVYNDGPDQYIQLHQSASAPANGAVPLFAVKVPSKGFASLTNIGYTGGLWVGNSSTFATKTAGSADCWFYAEKA